MLLAHNGLRLHSNEQKRLHKSPVDLTIAFPALSGSSWRSTNKRKAIRWRKQLLDEFSGKNEFFPRILR